MSKNLVIVESPSKSKTIEKYLGKDYKVVSSKGITLSQIIQRLKVRHLL